MKTVLRNLLCVLRRFKIATILNVLGLSVAFTAFMIIMMQVDYDNGYNKSIKGGDCIYRLTLINNAKNQGVICRPLAEMFTASSPHIKAGAIESWGSKSFFHVDINGRRLSFQEQFNSVSPDYVRVFPFVKKEGSVSLDNPLVVIIPESMEHKIFGNKSAIGQLLLCSTDSISYTVGGVYKDFPSNSSIQNSIYGNMGKENEGVWNNWNYNYYVRFDSPTNAALVKKNFMNDPQTLAAFVKVFGQEIKSFKDAQIDFMITPFKDLHFQQNVLFDKVPKASRQTTFLFFGIAFIILIIAAINYTNFSMALTPMRIKSINTQKVLGSSDAALRWSLIFEAIAISFLSFLIALFFMNILKTSFVSKLVDPGMSLSLHPGLIGLTALLSVLLGLFAGIYPSFYTTSFPPALVLKGSFGLTPKGRKLRSTLIAVQFIASFALVIGSLIVYLQNYYMMHTPLGYDKSAIIVSDMSVKTNHQQKAFKNSLKSNPEIEGVSYANVLLSSGDTYMNWGRTYHDKSISYDCLPVDCDFLKVMGIKVKEGRDFRPEDELSAHGTYIFNENARAFCNLKLDDNIGGDKIVGFVPDIKFASLRTSVSPMCFYVWGKAMWFSDQSPYYDNVYIKVKKNVDLTQAMAFVKKTFAEYDSDYPFNIRFYDSVLQNTYQKELTLNSLILLFSCVAIFISIVGVFGLVVFECEYRRKEIGIRKVLGSTTSDILRMFNLIYLKILLISFVIGAPLAYYFVHKWLQNFAYKTPIYWWIFAVALLLITLITVLTVTYQSWRVANENPIKNVKME